MENIRSELFFLKQFGFSNTLLQKIYLLGLNPVETIFHDNFENKNELDKYLTKKDLSLSVNNNEYIKFKHSLFREDKFLHNEKSKIYFKYDSNNLTRLLPHNIMPLFMYAQGDNTLLNNDVKRVAIIGTRKPSAKTISITEKITKMFVDKKFVIVSGLATGVDTISHDAALTNNGRTIAVLPTNFSKIYPKENLELSKMILRDGLLLTSVGPKENTYKSNFLDRNQYVACISDIVVVTETNLRSGTMNTIRNASEANKKILFVDQENTMVNEKIYEYGGEMLNGYL